MDPKVAVLIGVMAVVAVIIALRNKPGQNKPVVVEAERIPRTLVISVRCIVYEGNKTLAKYPNERIIVGRGRYLLEKVPSLDNFGGCWLVLEGTMRGRPIDEWLAEAQDKTSEYRLEY
ncbi:MAG: hypothetical protein WCV50_01655 [Patescibacteria group bacterium]|jgi:hypothetical protein